MKDNCERRKGTTRGVEICDSFWFADLMATNELSHSTVRYSMDVCQTICVTNRKGKLPERLLTVGWLYARVGQHNSTRYAVEMGVLRDLSWYLYCTNCWLITCLIILYSPVLSGVKIILFADDILILSLVSVSAAIIEELEDKCKLLVDYFTEWCLNLRTWSHRLHLVSNIGIWALTYIR